MPGLSRRQFLTHATALAAATGLSLEKLAPTLAAETVIDPESASTLTQTVLQGPVVKAQYRSLVSAPGEPYIPRYDVIGRIAADSSRPTPRSLLYMAHLSDMHVIEAQSPGRVEPMIVQDHASWASAFHPHDPLSPHVVAAMVKAFSDLRYSPVTGAPMGAAIVTGDSADMHSHKELRWYIDLLDGVPVDPAAGIGKEYTGLQAWAEAVWAYRPRDPAGGQFGDYGFPTLPTMLDDAIAQPVESVGLPAPWYAVYGNHDTLLLGTFDLSSQLHALALGGQKSYSFEATAATVLGGYAATGSALQRGADALGLALGRPGFKAVPADPERFLFEQIDFMSAHFETEAAPGPIGHGFTQHNLDSGQTWWSADLTPNVRGFGLDTCNAVAGPDGAVPDDQFQWLRGELEKAQAENKLALIFSHHNSLTLENRAQRPGEDQVLHGAEEFIDLLLQYPVVVGWLNGHTHLNQILAHPAPENRGGFWEITTASCIDFPQQQQVVEIVDNRDGSLSLFTTVVDHASPAVPGSSGSYIDLASQSRELASNDWAANPLMRRGSPLDRNTELLVRAPFDLSTITDAALEAQHMAERSRLVTHESGLPG
jgi:metallophosphoesterase (TIGR03767 family)